MPRGVYKAEKLFRMKQRQYEREGTGDTDLTPTELAAYQTVKQTGGSDDDALKAAGLSTPIQQPLVRLTSGTSTIPEGTPFWETDDFKQYATGLVKGTGEDIPLVRLTGGGLDAAPSVSFKVDPSLVPRGGPPKIDSSLRPGQRMYYDPDSNTITKANIITTGGTADRPVNIEEKSTYTVSGGTADRPTPISKGLIPLYMDRDGNLTADPTGLVAIYNPDPQERAMNLAAQRARQTRNRALQASEQLGYTHERKIYDTDPESVPVQFKQYLAPRNAQEQHELWKSASEPLVPVGYTADRQPFQWGTDVDKIKDTREQFAAMPVGDGWWNNVKHKVGVGALIALEKAYPALLGLGELSLRTEEFLQSPAVQKSLLGRGLNAIFVRGRRMMVGLKADAMYINYHLDRLTVTPLFGGEMTESQKRVLEESRLDMIRATQAYEKVDDMRKDIEAHLWENTYLDPNNPWNGKDDLPAVKAWGLTIKQEFKDIQELILEREENISTRDSYYRDAFDRLAEGDTEGSIEDIRQAIEYDINANPWANPYNSYTFAQEPERKEAFLEDVALLTLQKGSPLTLEELRRARQNHENFWVELTGQAFLDPLNLPVFNVVMDAVVGGGKQALKAVGGVADDALRSKATEKILVGKAYQYLTRQTVTSTANKVGNTTNNLLQRMLRAAGSTDDFKAAMRDTVIPALRKADDDTRAIADIFEAAKATPGGRVLENLSLDEFRQLTDAYSMVSGKSILREAAKKGDEGMRILSGDEWSTFLNDSLDNYSTEIAEKIAARTVDNWDDLADSQRNTIIQSLAEQRAATPRYAGEAITNFASKVSGAYVDYHRISTNSHLLDDTLSGMFTKWLQSKGGKSAVAASKLVEPALTLAKSVRDIWSSMVLSMRPAWVVQNLVDSTFRHKVYGGSIWDDMVTLFTSTQAHLADEIGIVPIEFAQALNRTGLSFDESVAARLLYSDWKPTLGPLSYINFERKRVKGQLKEAAEMALTGMPEGFRKSTQRLKNWFKVEGTSLYKGLEGGMADLNTSIEFTLRLRMFNREYFKLLRAIEPQFTGTLFEEVPEHLRGLANQIWRAAGSNPSKVRAYTEALEGAYKGGRAYWSFNIPPDIQKSVLGMTAFDQENFLTNVRVQVDGLVDSILKSGRTPQADDFKQFFTDLIGQYKEETEARLAEAAQFRLIQSRLPTDGTVSDIPTGKYLQDVFEAKDGASVRYVTEESPGLTRGRVALNEPFITEDDGILATVREGGENLRALQDKLSERGFDGIVVRTPEGVKEIVPFKPRVQFQSDVKLRGQILSDSANRLRPKIKKGQGGDFFDAYSESMRGMAEVERVPGDGVRVLSERGTVRIQIGEDVIKNTQDLKSRLYRATQEALYKRDEGYIRAKNLFTNEIEYIGDMNAFVSDPVKYLADNSSVKFQTFAQQLTENPAARAVLERLRNRRIKFEAANEIWEKYGRQFDLTTDAGRTAYLKSAAEQADELRMAPAEVRIAADSHSQAFMRLGKTIQSTDIPPEIRSQAFDFLNRWNTLRYKTESFYLMAFPGPRHTAPGVASGRASQWDMYFNLKGDLFNSSGKEDSVINRLAKMIEDGDIEQAKTMMDNWSDDFTNMFLKENGIVYELSPEGDNLLDLTINLNGKTLRPQGDYERKYFISLGLAGEAEDVAVPVRMASGRISEDVYENTYKALYNFMGTDAADADTTVKIMSNQASRWSEMSGRPIDDYFARFGITSDGIDEAMFAAYLPEVTDEAGGALPFGLSRTGDNAVEDMMTDASRYYLEDLRSASATSKKAAREFRVLKEFYTDGSLDYEGFSKKFLKYLETGKSSHKGYAKVFENYKSFLSGIYDDVLDTPIESKLDDAVNEMLSKVSNEVSMYPAREAEKRTLRIIADELGLNSNDKDVLRYINEDIREQADIDWANEIEKRYESISQRHLEYRKTRKVEFKINVDQEARAKRVNDLKASIEKDDYLQKAKQRALELRKKHQAATKPDNITEEEARRLIEEAMKQAEDSVDEAVRKSDDFVVDLGDKEAFERRRAKALEEFESAKQSLEERSGMTLDEIKEKTRQLREARDAAIASIVQPERQEAVTLRANIINEFVDLPQDFRSSFDNALYELPDNIRLSVEEGLMDALEGKEGGLQIYVWDGAKDATADLFTINGKPLELNGKPVNDKTLREYIRDADALTWGRGHGRDKPFIAFNTKMMEQSNKPLETLIAHELTHFYYNDMMDSAARPILEQYLDSTRREMDYVVKRLSDDTFLDTVKAMSDDLDPEIPSRVRETFRRFEAEFGYTHKFNPTKRKDLDIYAKLAQELEQFQGALKKATTQDGINELAESAADYTVMSLYFGYPQGQHFNVALADSLARQNKRVVTNFNIEEEIVAYSIERFGASRPTYDVYGPIWDAFLGKQATERFSSLDDATLKYGRDALTRQAQKLSDVPLTKPPISIKEEMDAAWDMWSNARDFRAFGSESDREKVDDFRDYLRREMLGVNPVKRPETYATYRHLMWQVEQFEDAVLTFHRGDDLRQALTPVIPEAQIDDGIRTWIRNNEYSIKNLEAAERTLRDWQKFLVDKADGKDPLLTRLTREEMDAMNSFADKAVTAKADLVSTLINGGEVNGRKITGTVDSVNHVMLDYQTRNNFDQIMSNFFPFWMFPSRSWPFWTETLATHPEIIAAYMKVKRASQSARYQAGAVNSKGEPLPSLEGYLPIQLPGMEEPAWINPLAPLSFRYVLDPINMVDDLRYSLQDNNQDIPPLAFMTKTLLEGAPSFGFYFAPWNVWAAKAWLDIPDYVLPQFPVLPQISLIPRWQVPDQIRLSRRLSFPTYKDLWYPEASWHDYLVEREILRDGLQKVQAEGMSRQQQIEYVRRLEQAIAEKGDDPLWQEAYQDFTNTSAGKSFFAYFTGIFTKDFSDADADLYALRNEMNLMKAALQNKVQMKIFFDETDQDYAMYDKYIDERNTPKGYLYQIYSDIGWITNESGTIERDPDKRAKLLAERIDQRNRNDAYHQAMEAARGELERNLRSVPIGAPWEQTVEFYDEYARQKGIAMDKFDPTFEYYGSSKSAQRIADDMTGRWYDYLWDTRPRWNPLEYQEYEDYEARVVEWEQNLPQLAARLMPSFRSHDSYATKVLAHLRDTQQLPQGFWGDLVSNSTADALDAFRKEFKDDVFDALNNAWEDMYWNPYWDAVGDYGGHERAYAEAMFLQDHPQPPTTQELYTWIRENYGDKFSYEEVQKWVEGNNSVMSFDERFRAESSEVERIRDDIWDILSWIAPGGEVRNEFESEMIRKGADRDFLDDWYDQTVYTNEEELSFLREIAIQTVAEMGLNAPSRIQLAEWAIAQNLNKSLMELVEKELPVLFSGEADKNEYDYYNSLRPYSKKKEYQKEYPEYYAMIQEYYKMRDIYGQANPLWAKYYNPEEFKEDTETQQVIPEGSPVVGGFTALDWPRGMRNTISPTLADNIESAYRGIQLSDYDITYLEQLKRNHPEWAKFIDETIAQGK